MILRVIILFFVFQTCCYANSFDTLIRSKLPDGINTLNKAGQYYAETIGFNLISGKVENIKILGRIDKITTVRKALLHLIGKEKVLVINYEKKQIIFINENILF